MTYDQFIHAVEGRVQTRVRRNVSVRIHTAVKNNGTRKRGLTIAEEGINISPTIYLEEYYQQFQQGDTLEAIAGDILKLYQEIRFRHSWDGEYIRDYGRIKDQIIYRLVNAEANQDLLKEVPHRHFLDLAVTSHILLDANPYGMASMMIRNEHLAMWGVTKEEIGRCASANTPKLLPGECHAMSTILGEGGKDPGEEETMYVMTNRLRSFGASAMLYEGFLELAGEMIGENYFVLPSSVHEVILVPESRAPGKEEMKKLVEEVNQTQVEEEEILSDQVYYYDCSKGNLRR